MSFFKEKLITEYNLRRLTHEGYSVRSFARDLKVPSATLSAVLNDKRSLPKRYVNQLSEALCLDQEDRIKFKESVDISKITLNELIKKKVDFKNNPSGEFNLILRLNEEKKRAVQILLNDFFYRFSQYIRNDIDGEDYKIVARFENSKSDRD